MDQTRALHCNMLYYPIKMCTRDSYMDRGKTIISQEVIQSFQGKETSQYDRKRCV